MLFAAVGHDDFVQIPLRLVLRIAGDPIDDLFQGLWPRCGFACLSCFGRLGNGFRLHKGAPESNGDPV